MRCVEGRHAVTMLRLAVPPYCTMLCFVVEQEDLEMATVELAELRSRVERAGDAQVGPGLTQSVRPWQARERLAACVRESVRCAS